jgi:hypothetical protein
MARDELGKRREGIRQHARNGVHDGERSAAAAGQETVDHLTVLP